MSAFNHFNLNKPLQNAIQDLGFEKPTPIQEQSFSPILAGKDVVGIAQTGTGKTLAYMLPVLQSLKFSTQTNPRILILVPTRELVLQLVEQIETFTKYINVRVLGVYGGTNIATQKQAIVQGTDILVATPRRLYDLALSNVLQLKSIKKLIIDEVDIMLDFGYKTQLINIFEYLPAKRQNIMFSATMTDFVDGLIDEFFTRPTRISIAVSGTRLQNIRQECYAVPNFYTKTNLLIRLLRDQNVYQKVLIFVSSKITADRLFDLLHTEFGLTVSLIHSSKEQNYRSRAIEDFERGISRILIATDVIARGIDLDKITNVINFDTPFYPENYIHRIGRTGRAEQNGHAVLLYTEREKESRERIEALMDYQIPESNLPDDLIISEQLTPEERTKPVQKEIPIQKIDVDGPGSAFHQKLAKNSKVNQGGKYRRELAEKYKKPQRRGDKIQNMKKKKRNR